MASATLELTTLFEAFSLITEKSLDENSVVCRLLDQWSARFSSEECAVAWADLDHTHLSEPSLGVFAWLLKSHERNEVLFDLAQMPTINITTITDNMLQTLMRRIALDAGAVMAPTDEWNKAVEFFYCSLKHALSDGLTHNNISSAAVAAVVDTRRVLDNYNHHWSVGLHHGFPAQIVQQMMNDPRNQNRVAQQELADTIINFCSNRSNRIDNFKKLQTFFDQIVDHPLTEQHNPNGVLYDAIKQLCKGMPAPVLKQTMQFLQPNGWITSDLSKLFDTRAVLRECYYQNHEYIDLVASLSNADQQAQLFTWVLEGIAWDFFRGIDHNSTTFSSRVDTILQKPYAKHQPLPISIATISPYLTYVANLWKVQDDPHLKKYMDNSPYNCVENFYSDLETYFKHTAPHFSSDDTFKAVELLSTVDSPSLRGLMDFWGRLHDVDYQLEGVKTMTPLQLRDSSSKFEKTLQQKIVEVQNYINISGAIDTSGLIKSPTRKM